MGVNFFRGHPSDSLLPSKQVLEAAKAVLGKPRNTDCDEDIRHPLTYGTDPGALNVRQTLAEWTNRTLGGSANADCINLTNGASFGAASALTQCCPPSYTRKAFVVSPTYFLINQILDDAGFSGRKVAIVEFDDGSLDLSTLETELKNDFSDAVQDVNISSNEWLKYKYVLYLVPSYSNPGGNTVPLKDRIQLLQLARKYDMLILCDEVYNWLHFGRPDEIPLLVTLDRRTLPPGSAGNVIANFSISKIMGPGLRVGWQEAATPQLAHWLSQTGAVMSGGTPAHLNTFIVKSLIDSGAVDEVLNELNMIYSRRAEVYRRTISKYFPHGTAIGGGKGGYFFWITLPSNFDSKEIETECKERGIIIAPGYHFEVTGDPKNWNRSYRISLSYHSEEEAVPKLIAWAEIIKKHAVN